MRRMLLVLLGFGVFAGYGSAIASARWHHRMHNNGGCEGRWEERSDRFGPGGRFDRRDDFRPAAPAAPAAAPQTVIVPQAAAPAPAAQPQVFIIMPGMQAAPALAPSVTVPVPAAAPAPATP